MHYLEDYEIGKTHDLGGYELSANEIITFGLQYDPQYYHIDSDQAQHSLFGGLIASGWQVAAIWMKLYVTTMLMEAAVEGSPGVDELRWFQSVRPSDSLYGTVTILRVTPSLSRQNCAILHKQGMLVNQHGEKVMQLILYSMFRKGSLNGDKQ